MRATGDVAEGTVKAFYPARNDALFLHLFSDEGSGCPQIG
jgi:hypothetical protein